MTVEVRNDAVSRVIDTYELSPIQWGMLFHRLNGGDSSVYVEQVVATLCESLHEAAFVRAWQRVVERHPVLRSRIRWEGIEEPVQDVLEGVQIPVERFDWRPLTQSERHERFQALLDNERVRGFDLRQAPLSRLVLVHAAEREHWVLWTTHHIMLDGVSRVLLWKEVFAFYESFSRGTDADLPLPRPYRDYIEWLRNHDDDSAKTYWQGTLAGYRATTPLFGVQRREADEIKGNASGSYEIRLSASLSTALRKLARDASVTLNMLLQGAWALLLNRYSGEPDIVFGVTRACRGAHLDGAADMFGLFINTLPVRVRIDPEAELVPWLNQLRAQQVALRDYEHTPLVKVQAWSDMPRGKPLFETILVYDNHTLDAQLRSLGGAWSGRHFKCLGQTNYPLTILAYGDRELLLQLNYSRQRFADEFAARMLGHLHSLLEAMVARPRAKLGDLPPLDQRVGRALKVPALLTELYNRNIYVWNEGDRLQCSAPTGALTTELLDQLRQSKNAILEYLRGPAELSFSQQRLWFLDQFEPGAAVYVIAGAVELSGTLDVSVLERALGALVDRHHSLRTVFVKNAEGYPLQVISEPRSWKLPVTDLSPESHPRQRLEKLLREEGARGFDLERGPLYRAQLYRLAPDAHVLLLAMHHIVSDGWSLNVLVGELGELYDGFSRGEAVTLPVLRLQYRDFARWQRSWLQGESLERLLSYWCQQLEGAPQVLELPTDRPRPPVETHRGALYRFTLPRELAAALLELSRREGATLFMTLLAGFSLLLSRYSGQQDLLVGSPDASRNRPEFEDLVGFFVNTIVLRTDLSGDLSVRQFLARTREVCLDANTYNLPFDRLVEELKPVRDLSRNPLFQVMFALQNAPVRPVELPGLSLKPVEIDFRTAKLDLTLQVMEEPEGLIGLFEYASDLFNESTIARMATCFRTLLEGMVTDPQAKLVDLPLLTDAERHQVVVGWNATRRDYGAEARLHRLIEAQAARTPDAVALEFEGRELSYAQLNGRANQLARVLRTKGVGPEVLVGVFAERSFEMVVALLAVLKAGGAYVPLDPSYPGERLRHMLEDARAPLVLAQPHLASQLPADAAALLLLDSSWAAFADEPGEDLEDAGTPEDLAYVIFTSGSTGRPKGAMNGHRGICNRLLWMQEEYGLGGDDRVLQKTPFSFDVSVWEFFWPLMTGARLVVARPEGHRDSNYLVQLIRESGITTLHFVPSMLRVFLEEQNVEACRSLRRVICSGEALPHELQERFFARLPWAELHNLYGPTEAAVDVTYWACQRGDECLTVPIGRPVANTQMYVLDAQMRPVPVGVAGELYIGGVQVGRGYVGRADLTAERFVSDPFSRTPGARLYRTGDLARHLADGAIEYLGRLDYQVKIRGQRIELGEIEATLDQHAGVGQSVVMAREDTSGDQRLVAYVVPRHAAPTSAELKEHLLRTLPQYMVPNAFVFLDALPLTSSGKVDRKALPAPERSDSEALYIAPRTPTEGILAGIWAEVLGIQRVGIEDNFFELGGHSLLAVSVIERMRRAGLHADVRALFATPTLAALAAAVGGGGGVVEVPPNGIPPGCEAITPKMLPLVHLTPEEIEHIVAAVPGGAANVQDIYPLAPLQEGILFHHLMASEGDPYLLYAVLGFDSRARLDRYLQALQVVIDRHDILRTAVLWEGLPEPVQVVWRRAPLVVEEVGLDAASGDISQELRARFDPRHYRLDVRQAPLLRVFIAHDAAKARWVMLLQFHHLSIDHTTLEVVQQEIQTHLLGEAGQLPTPLPFRNFVAQARLGVSRGEHEAFFRKMLGDVDEPTAPFGLTNVQGDGSGIAEAGRVVDASLAKRLRARARALGVSAASVCHLAWAQVLARASGRDDVVFGTVLFGRMQGGEGADRVLGLFINTLPVRIRVGEQGAQESVRDTHAQLAQLLRHEHAPLALAQRCSAVAAPAPLFSALLNYRHSGVDTAQVSSEALRAWEGVESLGTEERTNYPLVLSVDDLGQGFVLSAQVQTPMDPQRICGLMHTALDQLVHALESAPTRLMRSLDVLPDAERHQVVVGWNATRRDYGAEARLHRLIEAQAARTPDAVALEFEGRELSYAQLNGRANQLARVLRTKGVGPEVLVGVFAERSFEMVVALLAVLKAGGAYVPLDPSYPGERLRHMLEDARAPLVLAQPHLASQLPADAAALLLLDSSWAAFADEPGEDLEDAGTPEDLAYVIFTSGSTGRPKGAMNGHRGICNRLLWMQEEYGLGGDDRVLQKTPFSFDVSVWEFFWPLMTGARLVVARPEGHRDSNYLVQLIRESGITTLHFVPSMLRVFLEEQNVEACRSLRRVICSGEALPHELQERFFARLPWAELHNLYGPTEAAVDVTYWACQRGDECLTVPIGRPVANTQMYVLDAQMRPVPVGVAGELYIGGVQVGRGYVGRADLTAERFVSDPFSRTPGARLYRTGDLARHLADGAIEYLGRLDYQVKIRGQRIELGEIEATLDQHAGVGQSVVMAREDTSGDQRLVAYVVPRHAAPTSAELKEHLLRTLPQYMVPNAFVFLDALPLTSSGKVDRKALPAPERSDSEALYIAPRTPTEGILAGIWAEVLGIQRVGIEDNFFELGGHSLLAVTAIDRMRRAGLNVDVRALFTNPTLAGFAAATEDVEIVI